MMICSSDRNERKHAIWKPLLEREKQKKEKVRDQWIQNLERRNSEYVLFEYNESLNLKDYNFGSQSEQAGRERIRLCSELR